MREAIISFPMFGENFAINPPYCISIGNFCIYFYGIIIACGLLLGITYGIRNARRIGIEPDDLYDLIIWGVIAAIICARAYYVIFNWSAYALSLFWLLLLWGLVLWMLVSFYRLDRPAGLLQIPYLLWISFAAYLNLGVWLLNR